MAIDTLKMARRLREAGFSEPQADAVVVTKADLALLRAETTALGNELRAEIAALGNELRAEIAALRQELRAEIAFVRGEMREMEQRLNARMEALKNDILGRMMTMILTAVLINVVAVLGAMFVAVRLLAH